MDSKVDYSQDSDSVRHTYESLLLRRILGSDLELITLKPRQ